MQSNKVINLWSHRRWDARQKSQKWTIKRCKEICVVIGAPFRIWSGHVITSPFTCKNEPPKYSTVPEILSLILCKQSAITHYHRLNWIRAFLSQQRNVQRMQMMLYSRKIMDSTGVYWDGPTTASMETKSLYLVHVWHWESPSWNMLCHHFSVCPFTDRCATVDWPEKSFTRPEFDLQSMQVVSNIRCSHLQEHEHPPVCVPGGGVLNQSCNQAQNTWFWNRPNLMEPQTPTLPSGYGSWPGGTKTSMQSWTLILVLVHAAYNSFLLLLLDCGLVNCCSSATDDNRQEFKYI